MKPILITILGLCITASLSAAPLKVYILAGQSNMQGHASIKTFDYISKDPKTKGLYNLMTNDKGEPASTEKVWITYLSEGKGGTPTLEHSAFK